MNVLIIENDDAVRDSLALILEDAGHTVSHANDIVAGIDYLRASTSQHVVIMSNQTPDNQVLSAFFQRIVADPRLAASHCYIALTTAPTALSPQTLDALQALRAPVIQKPFNLEDLLAAITF